MEPYTVCAVENWTIWDTVVLLSLVCIFLAYLVYNMHSFYELGRQHATKRAVLLARNEGRREAYAQYMRDLDAVRQQGEAFAAGVLMTAVRDPIVARHLLSVANAPKD